MNKQELISELESAQEQLKDYNRFLDLLKDKDDPKGILTRLNRTVSLILLMVKMGDLKDVIHPTTLPLKEPLFYKQGQLVQIRPCGDEYGNKTYIGFLIGEMALGSSLSLSEDESAIQLKYSNYNPAIFVPELGKVIYGMESWWSEIDNVEQLKNITDDDINNVWYVKLLNTINNKEK